MERRWLRSNEGASLLLLNHLAEARRQRGKPMCAPEKPPGKDNLRGPWKSCWSSGEWAGGSGHHLHLDCGEWSPIRSANLQRL
jgi:hypothetical protein